MGRTLLNISFILSSFYCSLQYYIFKNNDRFEKVPGGATTTTTGIIPNNENQHHALETATEKEDLYSSLHTFLTSSVVKKNGIKQNKITMHPVNNNDFNNNSSNNVTLPSKQTNTKRRRIRPTKPNKKNSKIANSSGNWSGNYFSACLLIMDDNHLLPEWLAYHYTFLPLKRLIVGVDPNSITSPNHILDRFQPYINTTIWSDNDFGYQPKFINNATQNHRMRQKRFIQHCLATLKEEENNTNHKWVAVLDTDEYVVPNWKAGPKLFKIRNYNRNMTVVDIMKANPHAQHNRNSPCFANHRFRVTIKESTTNQVYRDVPDGIDANSLMTLRYRYNLAGQDGFPHGKSFVDISRLNLTDFRIGNHNPHRPVKSICGQGTLKILLRRSPFVIHHYAGSLEAFLFRQDPRTNIRNEDTYYKLFGNTTGAKEDDSARFWISNFVTKVGGIDKAKILLEGAGHVTQNLVDVNPLSY